MFHSLYKSKLYACILYNGKKVMEKISSKSLDLHAQQKCNKVVASQIAPPPPDKFLGMFPLSIFSHRQTGPGAEWAVSVEPSQVIWGLHFSSSEERWSRLIKVFIAPISLVFILPVFTRERHIETNFKFVAENYVV